MAHEQLNQQNTEALYRPWQIKIFIATFLAYMGYYFCRKPFYVAKAGISDGLHLSSIDLAQLGTAFLAAYMLGQFSSAFFGRKLGPKLLLIVGMAISIIFNFTCGISNSFWSILLFLGINGLAQGTGWPGCIGSLAFWFKRKQRGSVLGIWSTCYQIGSIIATSFAAFLLGRAGWTWSFFGGSLVLLVIWFVVVLIHPNRPADVGLPQLIDEEEDIDELTAAENKKSGWSGNVIITILMMGLIYFCIKFLRYAMWSWLPYFLDKNFSIAADNAGYLSTIFDVCGFGGVIASGFVTDKLFKGKRAFVSLIMLIMMTISFFMMYFAGSNNLLYFSISIGFAGFMLFGPDSLLSGVGAIDVGTRKGALSAAGTINGMGSIGPIFQEQLIGWMYNYYDHNLVPILVMLVIIAAVSAALAFFLWLRSRMGKANI